MGDVDCLFQPLVEVVVKGVIYVAIVLALRPSFASAETLDEASIRSDIIGKVMCVMTKSGQACVRHNSNGTSEAISGLPAQKGKWHIANNQQCVTWEKIRGGKELCFNYVKEGSAYSAPAAGGKITFK
jgi:hypothetical protein